MRTDPLYWLENYVWTWDTDSRSVRQFPTREELPYLYELAEVALAEQVLIVEKSSQMRMSWLFGALTLHRTVFSPNSLGFIQSKKQDFADKQLDRAYFIYKHMPPFLQDPMHEYGSSQLKLKGIESLLWAIPQGADEIRSFTASTVFEDEAAFQPEFRDSYEAILPRIGENGKLWIVSTPNFKEFFWELAKDVTKKEYAA